MNISDEQREQFISLIRDELQLRGWRQLDLAHAMNVSPNLISGLLRAGPFDGFRAKDLLKMVEVLELDISQVAGILGYHTPTTAPESDALMPILRRIGLLTASQRDWLMGVLDVLLRGMRQQLSLDGEHQE